jgi:hypothetical protein
MPVQFPPSKLRFQGDFKPASVPIVELKWRFIIPSYQPVDPRKLSGFNAGITKEMADIPNSDQITLSCNPHSVGGIGEAGGCWLTIDAKDNYTDKRFFSESIDDGLSFSQYQAAVLRGVQKVKDYCCSKS